VTPSRLAMREASSSTAVMRGGTTALTYNQVFRVM
jgi:hypothetical protein